MAMTTQAAVGGRAASAEKADRLPVTTHHLMPYFLDKYMGGMSNQECFEHFGLDPITWTVPHRPDAAAGEYYDPHQGAIGFLESRRIATDTWRVEWERLCRVSPYDDDPLPLRHPQGRADDWCCSPTSTRPGWSSIPIKEKRDIELIAEFATAPKCDVEAVNRGRRRVRRARRWCAGTSAASTSSASPAPGRTPAAWSARSG